MKNPAINEDDWKVIVDYGDTGDLRSDSMSIRCIFEESLLALHPVQQELWYTPEEVLKMK